MVVGQYHIQVFGFTDVLNILGRSIEDTEWSAQVLEQAASRIGLKINAENTKIIELLNKGDNTNIRSLTFKTVNEFPYLETVLSIKKNWSREID